MSFVNLHQHSHYSLLDGFGSPKDIVLRAKELNYPAIALTDHGVLYGLIEFYNEAIKADIKPLLGCEIYVARRTRFDKEAKIDAKPYHLTLIAENNEGYQNLLKLVTKAHLEGFYYKPRVDYGLLKAHSKGLIALSGCLAGHISQAILSDDKSQISEVIKTHLEIFGKENYFLEIQDHPLVENQAFVNSEIIKLSKAHNIGLVATNDSHYPRPEDSDVHDILLCIQTQTNVNDPNRMKYNDDYSIREFSDISIAFKDTPEAITNTLKIAERCNVTLEFDNYLIPDFKTPLNEKPQDYLKTICTEGLDVRFNGATIPPDYLERLDYELDLVHKMGFDTYFLIVHDFVKYAKDNSIVVGPGRGSAAGSIIAWSLNITDLDPIKYGLFFERFLNPERVSMPDIDIDFADNRRDEVLSYVIDKYGRDNVAQIITFGTMAPKAAIKDAGRALGYPYAEVDLIAKTVPPSVLGKYAPLIESIKDDVELKKLYDSNPRAKVVLDYAKKLEGTVRHAGTHACAVVISEKTLDEYTSLQYGAGGGGEIVTQYSAKPLEALGLLKMDFLGLRNLTVIENTCKFIKIRHDETLDISTIPLDDKDTFVLLQKADTTGVFQLESSGMRRYLKQLIPNKFEDIVAMGALYRPGPMDWIPTYIKGKHNPESVSYIHKSFKPILESTYGVAVYQEQILQLARDFAGFSLGEADILRKAVGKKITSLLVKQRKKFIKGAISKGHTEKLAKEVFEKVIEPFAGYGFNKAHAACYGMIAYQTAYLKAHYPIEFMTALFCSDSTNTDRIVLEIIECNEMGINVLPPSINQSYGDFTIVDDKTVRFGLTSIKGLGEGPVNEIIEKRNKIGQFKSLEEFLTLVPVKILNKKTIQALAYSGAFDEFGDRNQIAENYESLVIFAKQTQNSVVDGQTSIFADMEESDTSSKAVFAFEDTPKASMMQNLKWEKAMLGMYVSNHPLKGLKKYISRKGSLISSLNYKKENKKVQILGLLTNLRKILTKSGAYMAMFTVEDPTAKINAVIFPHTYQKLSTELEDDKMVITSGKLTRRQGLYQIICEEIKVLSLENMIGSAKESGLFDENEITPVSIRLLDDILDDEIENNEHYSISVPDNVSEKNMGLLKQLLMNNQGEKEVHLSLSSAKKSIVLPFKINLTDDLKKQIDSLLVSEN